MLYAGCSPEPGEEQRRLPALLALEALGSKEVRRGPRVSSGEFVSPALKCTCLPAVFGFPSLQRMVTAGRFP